LGNNKPDSPVPNRPVRNRLDVINCPAPGVARGGGPHRVTPSDADTNMTKGMNSLISVTEEELKVTITR